MWLYLLLKKWVFVVVVLFLFCSGMEENRMSPFLNGLERNDATFLKFSDYNEYLEKRWVGQCGNENLGNNLTQFAGYMNKENTS